MGLNPIRIALLICLACGGLLAGYYAGKHLIPSEVSKPPEVAASPNDQRTEHQMPAHGVYEEALPKNIVIETDGILKRFALPEPDSVIDLGNGNLATTASTADTAPDADAAKAQPEPHPAAAQTDAESTDEPTDNVAPANVETAQLTPPRLARALPDDIAELQRTQAERLPAWQRYALPIAMNDKAKIVIVMDDLGLDRRRSQHTAELPGPLTLSYMAYARDLAQQTEAAHAKGHEIMMHVPMEPTSASIDPGPNVLLSGMASDELGKNIVWNLDQITGYVGINNHMGSRFTADRDGMRSVVEALKARGLLFLDSVTSDETVAHEAARAGGIPFAVRNVFLDHRDDIEAIRHQLRRTEQVARKTGVAIAIGHPRDKTLAALKDWLPTLEEKGFQLVPITSVVRQATVE